MSKVFQRKLGTGDSLKIKFLSLASAPWLRLCLSHKKKKKKKNAVYSLTKCDVKVMTHLNFGRNNGKPAAVTSWGLGDVGGQVEAWGGGAT